MSIDDQQTGGLFQALLNKPIVNEVWYNQKELTLDGFEFKNCRFDGCKLSVTTTNFILDHCVLDESTVVLYNGDIMKVIQLFNRTSKWFKENQPMFAPIQNDDGTISILNQPFARSG